GGLRHLPLPHHRPSGQPNPRQSRPYPIDFPRFRCRCAIMKLDFNKATSMTRELVFYPTWTAGRQGYATRIREVFGQYLSTQNLRLTKQREMILDYLLDAEQHVTQNDVYQALRSKGVGKVTVFRTLKM